MEFDNKKVESELPNEKNPNVYTSVQDAVESTASTLGVRNHNPSNLRYSFWNKWQGQLGENKGFCVFSTMSLGCRAGFKNIITLVRRGNDTYEKLINTWAPPSENDTKAYLDYVCKSLNVHADNMIYSDDKAEILSLLIVICRYESNYNVQESDYVDWIDIV